MSSAVIVADLRKAYSGLEACAGSASRSREGEIFGLLGPNGAGKTTTVEILEGYRKRDGGTVTVLGEDPSHRRASPGASGSASSSSPRRSTTASPSPRTSHSSPATTRSRAPSARSSSSSGSREARRRSSGTSPAGSGAASTSGSRSSATRSSSSSTSRPRASTRGSPARVGDDRVAARPRQDDPAHDALPRGGRAPLDRVAVVRNGEIVALGPPSELTSHPPGDRDPLSPQRPGGRPADRGADEAPARADNRGARGRPRAGGLEVRRASLEDVYLSLTKEEEQE